MNEAQLVWFKRDLRITDHRPLVEAARRGPVIPLYVYEDAMLRADDAAARHLSFINECLAELDEALRSRGGALVCRTGDVIEVLEDWRRTAGVRHLWSHEETGNDVSFRRDRAVAEWCRRHNIAWTEFPQNGVVRRLSSRDGWAGRWARRMTESILPPPETIHFHPSVRGPFVPREPSGLGLPHDSCPGRQRGGRRVALDLQESFLHRRGTRYRKEMSSPVTAVESCSRLSPYLAHGCLSIREAYQAARERREELNEWKKNGGTVEAGWFGSLQSYLGRLRWHCHFMQKLEDEPSIEFRNFSRAFDGMRENDWNEEFFQAWCAGRTGYPLIDAVMRCLAETGWINFRMRAMIMSFASYHLWLHWRKPSLHLARVFTDYEPGIHYSQCQMQSGVTGINTVRIYSPIKQVADQDPDGHFIRQWVPELEGVPREHIAEPHRMSTMEQSLFGCRIDRDYPAPLVDHATAYRSAQRRIFAARQTAEARTEASRVQQKHGSRKGRTRSWR